MSAFDPAKLKLRFQLTFEGSWPTAVAFLGPRRLAAANQLGHLYIWDLPAEPPAFKAEPKAERQAPNVWPVRRLDGHANEVTRLAATPDGKQLVSTSLDHSVRIWPTDGPAAGKVEAVLDGDSRRRAARRAGKKEAAPAPGIEVETQNACDVLDAHKDWVHALGMSGDGKRIVTGDAASRVIVWDLASRKPIAKWAGHPWNWVVAASLSPDGSTALVSENRYKRDDFDMPAPALKLWDAATGHEKLDFLKVQFPKFDPKEHGYGPAQVWRKFVANGLIATAYSPDGTLVAVGQGGETETGRVHLLDAATGKLVRTVSGHQYGVTDVRFTADGKHVVSAGRDTCIRVCRVTDGKEVAVLGSPRGGQFKDWMSATAISPDERLLAATDISGLVHVWAAGT